VALHVILKKSIEEQVRQGMVKVGHIKLSHGGSSPTRIKLQIAIGFSGDDSTKDFTAIV
jgi:hypothetical protein